MEARAQVEAQKSDASAWDPLFFKRSALYWPLRAAAEPFVGFSDWPSIATLDEAIGGRAGVHFQAQPPKPRKRKGPVDLGAMYDARIHLEGWVPSRERNWHDFFNALVWATFPASKRVFHARQHSIHAARLDPNMRVLPDRRTRELDGLAILDEGGLLLLCAEENAEAIERALGARDVEATERFVAAREAIALPFGHALYESLLVPRDAPIWAMVALLPCPRPLPDAAEAWVSLADTRLAERIAEPSSFARPETFSSLPLSPRVLCAE